MLACVSNFSGISPASVIHDRILMAMHSIMLVCDLNDDVDKIITEGMCSDMARAVQSM